MWGRSKKRHALVLPGSQSGLEFLGDGLPCWEVFLPPPHPGWMHPTPTHPHPGSSFTWLCGVGNPDPLLAQMTPGVQGLAEHVRPAEQVPTSTFHPCQEALWPRQPGGSWGSGTCICDCPSSDPGLGVGRLVWNLRESPLGCLWGRCTESNAAGILFFVKADRIYSNSFHQ